MVHTTAAYTNAATVGPTHPFVPRVTASLNNNTAGVATTGPKTNIVAKYATATLISVRRTRRFLTISRTSDA